MSTYSIKDLENLSGIKAHTLRIWEQRFELLYPKRTETNIRYYTDEDLKLVLNIAQLKQNDFKISDIANMEVGQIAAKVMQMADQGMNYPDQINALTIAMIDLDEDRFDDVMDANIAKFGFENMMINIIYPFLHRVGSLWISGSIGPAQEHFMSNLIRQKLIAAIDKQPRVINENAKKFVLYCPEGELHEIGLLFSSYLLKANGQKVIYLGQSLPFADLEIAANVHQPDAILASITSIPNGADVHMYIDRLSSVFANQQIFLTGYQALNASITLKSNTKVLRSVSDLQTAIREINQ